MFPATLDEGYAEDEHHETDGGVNDKDAEAVPGQREHTRITCDPTLVHVYLHGCGDPIEAHIVEVSRGGLQLRTDRALSVDTRLRIETGYKSVDGRVCHCTTD